MTGSYEARSVRRGTCSRSSPASARRSSTSPLRTLQATRFSSSAAVPFADLTRNIPAMLDTARTAAKQRHIRPIGEGVHFMQLDDLAPDMLATACPRRVSHPSNLTREFSGVDCDRRSRRQGFCASPSQRHRSRCDRQRRNARRREPQFQGQVRAGFSARRIEQAQPGRKVTPAELDQLGLVAAPEQSARAPCPVARDSGAPRKWPDYARCLRMRRRARAGAGQTRRSAARISWCMTAIDWGWSHEATAARLMEESRKAQENGERYAARTVEMPPPPSPAEGCGQ